MPNDSSLVCQRRKLTSNPVFKMVDCEMQRDLSGGDQLGQHCVNSFGKGLRMMDVCIHSRFKLSLMGSFIGSFSSVWEKLSVEFD